MARQSTTPVTYNRTTRKDQAVVMTSGRAGKVVPVGYLPLLAGDACGGRAAIDLELREMPKPLLNGVTANIQSWFIPKSAHPQFPGLDELMHARTGENIKFLAGSGKVNRAPPSYFFPVSGAAMTTAANSEMFKTLGIHVAGAQINSDLIDAFNLVYNFRLAAHSSKLPLRKYAVEDMAAATTLPPAFWPSSRFARVVPDYERALVVGSFDLDVIAGEINFSGNIPVSAKGDAASQNTQRMKAPTGSTAGTAGSVETGAGGVIAVKPASQAAWPAYFDPGTSLQALISGVQGNFAGDSISVTLADIDKARTTQAFAKLRTSYAGNDATGMDNDDTIVAHLMQGLSVEQNQFARPWLLDSKRVAFGMAERFATDSGNLEASVTRGRASATLSLNVPQNDVGGVIIITVEVLPERIDERMADEWLQAVTVDQLPNALRDVQRTEPVDHVTNRRIDAKHSSPNGLYGYEPMNDKWNRDFTRLGGIFYQGAPGAGFTENRANIWQTEIVNPTFSGTHYLAPVNFPHDVFSDTLAPAFEVVCRHRVAINGLTQIGDVLAEDNNDYAAVEP